MLSDFYKFVKYTSRICGVQAVIMGCCMLTGSRVTWTSLFFSDLHTHTHIYIYICVCVCLYLICIFCIFTYFFVFGFLAKKI